MNKLLLYIKSVLHSVFDNKLRLSLSVSGIFIAVFVYFCGNVLVNSYYRTNYSEANIFSDNSFIVLGDAENHLQALLGDQPISVFVAQSDKTLIDMYDKEKDRYVTITASIHFTTENGNIFTTVPHDYSLIAFEGELIKGRYFNSADYAHKTPAVIINESTEKMLFQGEDAIGKTIQLSSKVAGTEMWTPDMADKNVELVVVGVIKDTVIDLKKDIEYRKALEGDSNVTVNTVVYCPSSFINECDFETEDAVCVYSYDSIDAFSKSFEHAKNIGNALNQTGEQLHFLTKVDLLKVVELNMQRLQSFFKILMLTLSAIIGFSISVTIIFSMKERISEIGIRKAFGATWQDIVLMCFLEMILISLIGSVCATGVGYVASREIAEYLSDDLFIFILYSCTHKDVLLPIITGVSLSLIFGFLPCVYAASVKTIKALKFE